MGSDNYPFPEKPKPIPCVETITIPKLSNTANLLDPAVIAKEIEHGQEQEAAQTNPLFMTNRELLIEIATKSRLTLSVTQDIAEMLRNR